MAFSSKQTSQFQQPQFLTEQDQPVYRIRCPIHGFIHFSENERKIIDHHLFRRLRWIKQLALTDLIYPGASHTRFEHSLGVMELATRAFDQLASRHGTTMQKVFSEVAALRDDTLAKARQLVRLAALLHDVGHACFSHAAEEVVHKDAGHEALAAKILKEKDVVKIVKNGKSKNHFFEGCDELAAAIIDKNQQLPPQMQVLRDIVSGQMDADRTDYLLRDSLHCGVDYGVFDYRRMIECLELFESAGSLEMALHRDGIHTFEALILARYQMNTQVYYHRLRRIYDLYLKEYFKAKGDDSWNPPEKILEHNDVTMMTEILRNADKEDEPYARWAKRIRNRDHHRMVFETGEDADAIAIGGARQVFDEIRAEYPEKEFLLDIVKDVSIHKLLIPGDQSDQGFVQMSLIESDGSTRLVGERSHILKKVPRWFQTARIFCDCSRNERDLQKKIADRCKTLYQQRR